MVQHDLEPPSDVKIVNSTIELAHGLGLRVVAEGTEDAAAFDQLRGSGCDIAQGYGVSRPIPEDALIAVLSNWSPLNMPGALQAVSIVRKRS